MKTILFIALCILSLNSSAQLNGRVADEKGLSLPSSIVRIYAKSKLIKTILTDTAGDFSTSAPEMDQLIITAIGYRSDTIITAQGALGTIRLQLVTNQLTEVRIQGRQALITQQTDRSVITVNGEIKKLASNGLDILGLAPGITISDNEDRIAMSGKSQVQIMINGKVVNMTPSDLAKMLRAMPTQSIKQVEFMTSPPSKYEVNGNTGIINIRTLGPVKGVTGNIDLSSSQANNNWLDLSGLFNYGTGKLAISGYGAWHRGGYHTRSDRLRQLSSGTLSQTTSNLDKWSDPVFRIAMDYTLGKKSTLGGIIEREASTNRTSYDTYSQQGASSYQTTSLNPNSRHWTTYNLNYRFSDTAETEFTIDLDRADFSRNSEINLQTTSQPNIDYSSLTIINISTAKADYVRSFKKSLKIEAGLKIAEVKTSNRQDDNLFDYKEKVHAGYAGLSGSAGRFGWQLGLRLEQTSARGETAGTINPDTSYLNLLPSAYLTYKPSEKHHFRLSLSRRIKRPDYSDLEPFVYQIDPLNHQAGNAGLRAQRNDQAEMTYTYNDRIILLTSYRRAKDYFATLYRQSGNLLIQLPGNAGEMQALNFDLNYPIRIAKWWNMLHKLNIGDDQFRGQLFQGQLDQNKWRYQISTSQRFSLSGSYQLQLSGRYSSASQDLIYYQKSSANLSASISKKLLRDQASLRLAISDIFKTQRNYTTVNFASLNYSDLGTFESRRISVSFNWRFGNSKIRQTQQRERGDAEEKGRSGS